MFLLNFFEEHQPPREKKTHPRPASLPTATTAAFSALFAFSRQQQQHPNGKERSPKGHAGARERRAQGRRGAATQVDPDPGGGTCPFSFRGFGWCSTPPPFISLFLSFPSLSRDPRIGESPRAEKCDGRECRTREGASTNQLFWIPLRAFPFRGGAGKFFKKIAIAIPHFKEGRINSYVASGGVSFGSFSRQHDGAYSRLLTLLPPPQKKPEKR